MNSGDSVSKSNQVLVLDEPLNLRHNMLSALSEHRPFFLLLAITVALDAASTIAFMTVLGPGAEQNPIVRQLSYSFGIVVGPPVGKLFQIGAALGLTALAPRLAELILSTVILMNLFAFVINMHAFMLAG